MVVGSLSWKLVSHFSPPIQMVQKGNLELYKRAETGGKSKFIVAVIYGSHVKHDGFC